jgi:hypothetical protein
LVCMVKLYPVRDYVHGKGIMGYRVKRGKPSRHFARARKRKNWERKQGLDMSRSVIIDDNPNLRTKKKYIGIK